MKIKITRFYQPWVLKAEWKGLEEKNPYVLPFQKYDFFARAFMRFLPYCLVHKSVVMVLKAMADGKTVALIPMEKSIGGV